MSKADGRHDTSKKRDSDDKDDDDKECKDDDHSDSSNVAKSSLISSNSGSEDGSEHDGDEANCKVTICHIPPGNHCNEHTIRVGKSAVPAHIAHGDYPGSCDAPPPPPPPPPPAPACMPETAACVTTADCCPGAGLACQANVCAFVG